MCVSQCVCVCVAMEDGLSLSSLLFSYSERRTILATKNGEDGM